MENIQYRFSLADVREGDVKVVAGILSDKDLPLPDQYEQRTEPDQMIILNPEQLVMEVIEIMLQSERYTLPLYNSGVFAGLVRFKDLIGFLVDAREGHNLLLHKLNFTLETALIVIAMDNISVALDL